ncbi:2OG-Fe dioxygenase family protein [Endozoicomonas gorgoniicola]|uniref:2OG-Fe dioxygenase family protein n=1 Tax=Endozoicomonas gorgoniicola TaxID=1234144 RepID=A0ABT3N300_9GAMM|nr:2OG-Fe dioxygenase family protein [Endozoicomonas gorgoniicola]MCW7556015.1 2OG-Fe dioxygenase family protein [Endozoicomonas gorgoniicola]
MYKITKLKKQISSSVYHSFSQLGADNYLRSNYTYRYRAYDVAEYINGQLNWMAGSEFYQSKNLNDYAGGLNRTFDPLSSKSKNHINDIATQLIKNESIPEGNYKIGCHQIRTVAEEGTVGYPAPEGFHQDGFDYLAIYCVALENINGAASLIKPVGDDKKIYEYNLLPEEIMVLDDREVKHFVTPFTTKLPNQTAIRDVFVITFTTLMD